MTIDMKNIPPNSPALVRTIQQVVSNQSVYAPDINLALCMSRFLYEKMRQAYSTNVDAGPYLCRLPVYVFDVLPPERLYLVPEYVAQAWCEAEPKWIRSLCDIPLNTFQGACELDPADTIISKLEG